MSPPSQVGLLGLGAMGTALGQHVGALGHRVVGYDRCAGCLTNATGPGSPIEAAADPAAVCAALQPPRILLLMVPAGAAVDWLLDELAGHLGPEDVVIDGGNSHFQDTQRRVVALADRGEALIGAGISGGVEGARSGACIMAGGDEVAWQRVAPLLRALAAEVDGEPCAAHLGPDGAGHFVKLVHNGIEYAEMQLLAECYLLLKQVEQLGDPAMVERLARWNEGANRSFLLELTADILTRTDPHSGAPVLDVIRDVARHKGTGRWAATAAIDLGVAAPTLVEAVAVRAQSEGEVVRRVLDGRLRPRPTATAKDQPLHGLAAALLAARIAVHVQGFDLLAAGSRAHLWHLDLAAVARLWRGGCIIRSALLEPVAEASTAKPAEGGMLGHAALAEPLATAVPALRAVVARAVQAGVPVPCLASALTWLDGAHTGRLSANLIQAQRDAFGAHGLARTDRPGRFHLDGSED